jgi:hypothetical protein
MDPMIQGYCRMYVAKPASDTVNVSVTRRTTCLILIAGIHGSIVNLHRSEDMLGWCESAILYSNSEGKLKVMRTVNRYVIHGSREPNTIHERSVLYMQWECLKISLLRYEVNVMISYTFSGQLRHNPLPLLPS